MLYIVIILTVYSARYLPELYSRPLLVLPALGILLVLSGKEEGSLMILLLIFVFSELSSSLAVGEVSTGLVPEKVTGVYGTVTSDTVQRSDRKTGFYIRLSAVSDRGSIHSAGGEVFVIAPQSDCLRGDEVYLEGGLSDGFLKAGEVLLVHRPALTKVRRKMLEAFRRRLNAGELGLRLLTGSGDDGGYPLTALARDAGLSHVLALSGMHLAVLSSILEVFLKRLTDKAWGISTAFLAIFTWLSGSKASLLRALCHRIARRFLDREEALLLSFLVTMLLSPLYASSLALHYAMLSLSGIFLLSAVLSEELSRVTRLPLSLTGGVMASASALLLTVPVTMEVFGSYTLGALLTSAPASFLISLYLTISLLTLIAPVLGFLLVPLEEIVTLFFSLAAKVPSTSSWVPYLVMLGLLSLLIISKAVRRMVDFR